MKDRALYSPIGSRNPAKNEMKKRAINYNRMEDWSSLAGERMKIYRVDGFFEAAADVGAFRIEGEVMKEEVRTAIEEWCAVLGFWEN